MAFDFDRARDAAVRCIGIVLNFRYFFPYGPPISAGQPRIARGFSALAHQYLQARNAMPPDLLEAIEVTNAKAGNLNGVMVGTNRYCTFHEAAMQMAEALLETPLTLETPTGCAPFAALLSADEPDWSTLGAALAAYAPPDGEAYWNRLVAAVDVQTAWDLNRFLVEIRRECAFAKAATGQFPSESNKPNWNCDSRELSIDGKLCKRFRRPSPNQIAILDALQLEGWPDRIDDPIPFKRGHDQPTRLREAVRSLNDNKAILFEADGTGKGVTWRRR